MLRYCYVFLLLPLLCFACNDGGEAAASTPEPATVGTQGDTLPSLPIERLEYLWNNSDYMDIVFYQLPASINQSNQQGVRSTLMHIGGQTPILKPDCQSIGRIFFQVAGKNQEQAEIYFQPGCAYYVWLDNDKPTYANGFTDSGIAFYNNIIQSVQSGGQ